MTPAADYAGVLDRLGKLRLSYTLSGLAAWYARCPVCQDRSPTHLRLWVGDSGKLHAKCFGGECGQLGRKQWWQAMLTATGTKAGDWFPADGRTRQRRKAFDPMAKIIATYDYRDHKGRLLYQCVKYAKGSPQKCSYRRPAYEHDDPKIIRKDDKSQPWVWDGAKVDLDKLAIGEIVPGKDVLYRLPELLAADRRHPVLIPEGEPDVEVLRSLGFIATTNPHGGRGWPSELGGDVLGGRRVVLFEDNDRVGHLRVSELSGLMLGFGALSVRLVRFREFPEQFDVTDWLRQTQFPEMPESGLAPAWLVQQKPKALADARKAVAELCKLAPEWSVLTGDEQKARLAALNKPEGPSQTLQEALEQQERAA